MVDITSKINTLRTATAQAIVKVGTSDTIEAVKNKEIPKGDVFEVAKTAGLFAVKRTSDMIPDCHPLPVEATTVEFSIEGLEIAIHMSVKTIYKTGVEVEAMHGASVVALTIYDMLKPVDKQVEIQHIKLLQKSGGSSDFSDPVRSSFKAGIVVCSDSISAGKKEDKAGKAIIDKLEEYDLTIADYSIIPDEKDKIQQKVHDLRKQGCRLIIFTGGTGLSKRDVTPEAVSELIERRVPGIEEAIRSYGQDRMPYAMLSRSVAGTIGDSLLLALPGSTNGAKESMDAVFPPLFHIFRILKGSSH
ncbi:bifunctional molybdenum cofactor biosynthesis protein MoaC/MoaB [Halalkalibaculum sp. DA3122]|uniref:bifunctional molybdenum cofactor biosynthesis protein MoaC/MoaB n=1 Tax=Halalkalibaculum sp. DA3122 TaxID=3373607 RepID=UPI0037540D52